jgi:hypothetical protein
VLTHKINVTYIPQSQDIWADIYGKDDLHVSTLDKKIHKHELGSHLVQALSLRVKVCTTALSSY